MFLKDLHGAKPSDHRRSIEKEAKANSRHCFTLGKLPRTWLLLDFVADKFIKGGQGGIFVYYIFYYRYIDFPSNVLRHSGKYCIILLYGVLCLLCVCTVYTCTDGNIVFICDSDKNSLVIISMF